MRHAYKGLDQIQALWRNSKESWQYLMSSFALKVLRKPASAVSVERTFSAANVVGDSKRASMNRDNLTKACYCYYNHRALEKNGRANGI